ncbi:MAG TPA: sensor histidine kinase [Candidatus Saccharimonadales bacterium]|nr:sensor histidine kinase [Candidatus Saccharimonadales bacterium]
MRLIEKIILLLLGLALVPLMVVGGLLYQYSIQNIEQETEKNLNSIATIQEHRIANNRAQNLERLTNFTSRPQLKTILGQYDNRPTSSAQAQLMANIAQAKSGDDNLSSITIITNKGIVAASTVPKRITSNLANTEIFKAGMLHNNVQLVSSGESQKPVFYLFGPLQINGKVNGVAEIEVGSDDLLATIQDYTGLEKTGETTIAKNLPSGQSIYLTSLRFDRQAAFNRTVAGSDIAMSKALGGKNETIIKSKDYRGVKVLAATRYIKDSQWGLVVKIDQTEAFQAATQLRSEFLLLSFISSVLIVFSAIYLAQRATQPILDIDEVAEEVSRGKLVDRVHNSSNDELGNLATTFNSMLDNLEVLDKSKSDFVSLASHQLRTPLTSIKWYAEALLDPKFRLSGEKQKHYLQQLYASNERMIELVNALLNVSRIDFDKLPAKDDKVYLKHALEQVINDESARIREKSIVIDKKFDKKLAPIYIDRSWIRVILQDLISNAIKYSAPKQHVSVVVEQLPKHVLIHVKDTGFGIPMAQQNKIFTKFFRADNARKQGSDGSGLGMYITKAMVERAGGTIWFESKENEGTTFYVKLPTNGHLQNKSNNDKKEK